MFYPLLQGQKGEAGEKGENGDQVNLVNLPACFEESSKT